MIDTAPMPGRGLKSEKMPGHWLLARLGKRVLRPGGRELTHRMIQALNIQSSDSVVEFAPGLGETSRLTLAHKPASFMAVERDRHAAAIVQKILRAEGHTCVVGLAEETGLPDASATVVYGEAMLTMQPPPQKTRIIQEAFRLLKPGGRYGIHEMCLVPGDLSENTKQEIQNALGQIIHHGVRPLTPTEWQTLLQSEGFSVRQQGQTPMHLLEPARLIQDEGIIGALRFVGNVIRNRDARHRVLAMHHVFHKYRDHLAAIMMIGHKPECAP